MATLEQIQARLKKLQAQADAIVAKQSSTVLEKIRGLMEQHGLTTADIDTHVGRKKRGPKAGSKAAVKSAQSVAKYRDPKSGATWSGHGRAPGWIATAKNRDPFLIDASTATPKPPPATKTKAAGNYLRGPQPAMYRDPKSGATWSGRGRAPEWIAGAKDRRKFLISGGAEANVAATAGPSSKGKTAGKKASKAVGATGGEGQRKGPQPALYRDPKSGATWSGRGRAPAWLAGAKNHAKFSIDASASATALAKTSKEKVATNKSVAEKVVLRKTLAPKKSGVPMNTVVSKSSGASRKASASPAKRPVPRNVSAEKPAAGNVVPANPVATDMPEGLVELSA